MHKGKPTRTRAQQGEATRARILGAARQRFAADGYERATIRAVAVDAGVDPSLVMRYFGNKQGLFVAAADFDLRIPDVSKLPREKMGAALVEHFLQRWEADDILMALLRTAATNEHAAERMREVWGAQPVSVVAAAGADSKMATLRAALIDSQFLGFAYSRWILKMPAVVAMSHADVVRWLGPVIQHYLFARLPALKTTRRVVR